LIFSTIGKMLKNVKKKWSKYLEGSIVLLYLCIIILKNQ
jgi:hypothetical protein